MPEEQKYAWIQTHKELVDYLKTMRDKQEELINLLSEVGVTALDYTDAQNNRQRIRKIDPFSFFLMIYKYGPEKCLKILQNIATRLQIFVPSDLSGYTRAYVQSTWLVGYQGSGDDSEINQLWDFFFIILEDKVTDELFARTKAVTGMELVRLSASMYLIAPERYLPINDHIKTYLDKEYGIKQNTKYLELLSKIKATTNAPFYEILDAAYHLSSDNETSETRDLTPSQAQSTDTILSQYPLNLILYGPPGTGKTYNTIIRAAEIIERRPMTGIEEAKEVFNRELGNRIEFITFHQNYSYEDFIQGLRPDVQEKGSLSFTKSDGVFMRCCVNALYEYYKHSKKTNSQVTIKPDPAEVYLDFIDELEKREDKDMPTISQSTVHFVSSNSNKNIEVQHAGKTKKYLVSRRRLLELYKKFPQIEMIKNIQEDIRNAIRGCNATCYWAVLNQFIKYFDKYSVAPDIAPDVYEDQTYESKKDLLNTIELQDLHFISEDVPRYVIVIDEINRANMSRVFGELITLIEPDKRSHGEIPLKCTLPSGDEFMVPSNLYIIGTMNTADKSLALLDIALRRRFEFEAMYPLYNIPDHEIHDVEILRKINEKIAKKKGCDYQIGHSYFMGKDYDRFKQINSKVIPLLMEYFMNDRKEITEILHYAGLEIVEDKWPIKIEAKDEQPV